ncbi:type IV pilus assembly protein PilM [Tindallia californiensis]|uniref:Type IV pilus assembly protein PilM n=1 Tax=Tindallia californiensis TaxID=159292 RepID=A0A1H3NIA4_9FIRM|nr:type IV pilus assembly protein PilM [Tindallia californiensis]SDY88612.1 type IV pilus assembly protein PilM [Tindallia californiensis]
MKKNKLKLIGKEVIVFDFGHHSIKIVVGKPLKDKILIQQSFTVETPEGSFKDGKLIEPDLIRHVLQQSIDEHKIKTRNAICTIESSEIITRELNLPKVSEEKMQQMLAYEVEQTLPIQVNEYIIQSKFLNEVIEEGVDKNKVLVTAVPKEMSRGYFELLSSIGLRPLIMDLHFNEMDKLLESKYHLNNLTNVGDKTIALIDLGYQGINIVIVESGIHQLNRLIHHGSHMIDQNIVNFMDVSHDDAIEMKKNISSINQDPSLVESDEENKEMRVINIVQNILDGWMAEIERIFKFYLNQDAKHIIDKILLYGGTSRMVDVDRYFEEYFNIPTSVITSLTNIEIENASKEVTLYVNALGAMIRK